MDIHALATDFVALLQAGDHQGAAAKYNSPDIVSYEAMGGAMAECKGTAAVQAKSDWWYANHEMHKSEARGPYVNGSAFAVHFSIDVTAKDSGKRMQMDEIGLYTVKDGKIIEERFFYSIG